MITRFSQQTHGSANMDKVRTHTHHIHTNSSHLTSLVSPQQLSLDETQGYETFKENAGVEAQQTMDDLDDFERRLAGGPAVSKAAVSRAPPPMRAPAAPKAGAKKGSEYVKASRAAKSEEEQDAEDARNAVSDLDKFDQKFGY